VTTPTPADDEFHAPTSDSVEWSETCWFTFAIAERNMSVQFYPYFRQNLGVAAGAVYVWDGFDGQPSNCRYAKNFWHLPMPTTPLSDLRLDNGITYQAVEPLRRYHIAYADPDGGDLHIDLHVQCLHEPFMLHTHFDQATTAQGSITLDGETFEVDCVGFRDRSWGVRSQFGPNVMGPAAYASYSWGSSRSGDHDGFFSMCADFGNGSQNVHGYIRRDGKLSPIATGTRRVVERAAVSAYPTRIELVGTDSEGRSYLVSGSARNNFGWAINPNLYTINALMEWSLDGSTMFGEDHDNWSAASIRAFHRSRATG